MTPVGRRPGDRDTRRRSLTPPGPPSPSTRLRRTSLPAIAHNTGVDPSLVHHYFDGKAALFVAALDLPADPRDVKDQIEVATSARGTDNGSATNDEPVDDDWEDTADSEDPGPPLSGLSSSSCSWPSGRMATRRRSVPGDSPGGEQLTVGRRGHPPVPSRAGVVPDPTVAGEDENEHGPTQCARRGPARRVGLGSVRPTDRAVGRRATGRDRPVGRADDRPLHDGRSRRLTPTTGARREGSSRQQPSA